MTTPEPPRLDSAALERVLHRAAEMQAAETDVGEGLTEREVLELGRQVGIPGRLLQQAMLEERSRVALSRPATLLDAWVGPGEVLAQRVVMGDPEAVERALLHWMEKHELVSLQRQQRGRISWERLGGMQAALKRGASVFQSGASRFMLARADLISATVTPLENGYCHVALTATLTDARRSAIGGAVAAAGFGAAGSGVLAVLGAMMVITPIPLIGGAVIGYFVTRGYPPVAQRVQLGLERVLDFVERGAVKSSHQLPPRGPGLVELLTSEVRRALTAPPGPGSSGTPRKP